MAGNRKFRVRLTLSDLDAIRNLEIDHECMPMRRRDDGMIEMVAIATEGAIGKLRRLRKHVALVDVLSDAAEEGKAAMKLVSRGNRYARGEVPRGVGTRAALDRKPPSKE